MEGKEQEREDGRKSLTLFRDDIMRAESASDDDDGEESKEQNGSSKEDQKQCPFLFPSLLLLLSHSSL